MKNKGLISGLVLLSLGLISGLLLAVINGLTFERIEEEELRLKFAAIREFYDIDQYDLEEETLENGSIYVLKNKNDQTKEHLVYSLTTKGYGDEIEMLVAVNKDLSIQGYKVTAQNESPGIGTKILDKDFKYTNATDLSKFDSISGATVSSSAVKVIFAQVAARVKDDFGGVEEPLSIADFYDVSDFNVQEVSVENGKIHVLKNKTTNAIEHIVYALNIDGFYGPAGDKIEMLIAVNSDLSIEGYGVVSQSETDGFGSKIVDHDFKYTQATDLSEFDSIANATKSSNAVKAIFTEISARVEADFGGALNE